MHDSTPLERRRVQCSVQVAFTQKQRLWCCPVSCSIEGLESASRDTLVRHQRLPTSVHSMAVTPQPRPISIAGQLRRFYFWRPESDMPDQFGKVAIVTGGSSGIGFQVVKHLAAKHATIINATHNLPAARK